MAPGSKLRLKQISEGLERIFVCHVGTKILYHMNFPKPASELHGIKLNSSSVRVSSPRSVIANSGNGASTVGAPASALAQTSISKRLGINVQKGHGCSPVNIAVVANDDEVEV